MFSISQNVYSWCGLYRELSLRWLPCGKLKVRHLVGFLWFVKWMNKLSLNGNGQFIGIWESWICSFMDKLLHPTCTKERYFRSFLSACWKSLQPSLLPTISLLLFVVFSFHSCIYIHKDACLSFFFSLNFAVAKFVIQQHSTIFLMSAFPVQSLTLIFTYFLHLN